MVLSFVHQVFMANNDSSLALSPHHPLDVKFTTIAAKFNTLYSNTTSINSGFIYEYKFNHSTVSCLTVSLYLMSAYIGVGEIHMACWLFRDRWGTKFANEYNKKDLDV